MGQQIRGAYMYLLLYFVCQLVRDIFVFRVFRDSYFYNLALKAWNVSNKKVSLFIHACLY